MISLHVVSAASLNYDTHDLLLRSMNAPIMVSLDNETDPLEVRAILRRFSCPNCASNTGASWHRGVCMTVAGVV